ncbi:MAG: hypothetical protein WC499_01650 [Patescibacteria group bacterium]
MAEKSKGRKVDDALLLQLAKFDSQFIELRNQFTNPKSHRRDLDFIRRVIQWLQEGKEVTLAGTVPLIIGERFTPSPNNPFPILEANKNFHLPYNFTHTPIYTCLSSLIEHYGDLNTEGFEKKFLKAKGKADKLAKKYGINRQRIIPIIIPSLKVANRIADVNNPINSGYGLVIERGVFPLLENRCKKENVCFENWCNRMMAWEHLEFLRVYRDFLTGLTDDINIVLLLVDAFQGYSVQACRWELDPYRSQIIPAGSFVVAHLLVEMPQILSEKEHIQFDAPGDLYRKEGKFNIFSSSVGFNIRKIGGVKKLIFSGDPAECPDSTHSSVVILNG